MKPHAVTTCADFNVAWYSLITGSQLMSILYTEFMEISYKP